MKNVILNGGFVVNGKSEKLNVEISSGMTGKQLMKWKAKNEAIIIESLTCNNLPAVIGLEDSERSECSEDSEGDRFGIR